MPFKDLPMILMLIFQFPARVIARGEMNSCPPGMSVPCRLVVHDGAGSLLRIPDSWDGTRLHPPGYWKRANQKSSMFAKICQGHRWCWPILESFPRHEPLMGKSLCQPSVATFLRGDGAPGGGIRGRSRRWFFDFFPVDPCDPVTITASLKRFYDVLHGLLTIVLCHYARNTRPLLPSGNQTWQWNHPFLIIYRRCSY